MPAAHPSLRRRRPRWRPTLALLAALLGGCCTAPPGAEAPVDQDERSASALPEPGAVSPRRAH